MSLFRKDPTEAEEAALVSQLRARREARQKAEEAKAKAVAEETAKNRPPPDPMMPKVTFGRSFRRFNEAEVEAIAEGWRARYDRFDDPEISRAAEEKLQAALKADGYEVPPKRPEVDPLKRLLRRQAAKGNN
jgi:hypothetical protein